jgi:hypothetical protein
VAPERLVLLDSLRPAAAVVPGVAAVPVARELVAPAEPVVPDAVRELEAEEPVSAPLRPAAAVVLDVAVAREPAALAEPVAPGAVQEELDVAEAASAPLRPAQVRTGAVVDFAKLVVVAPAGSAAAALCLQPKDSRAQVAPDVVAEVARTAWSVLVKLYPLPKALVGLAPARDPQQQDSQPRTAEDVVPMAAQTAAAELAVLSPLPKALAGLAVPAARVAAAAFPPLDLLVLASDQVAAHY